MTPSGHMRALDLAQVHAEQGVRVVEDAARAVLEEGGARVPTDLHHYLPRTVAARARPGLREITERSFRAGYRRRREEEG